MMEHIVERREPDAIKPVESEVRITIAAKLRKTAEIPLSA